MGYMVGRVIISFVLLPHYFRGDLYTAYELIERRLLGKRLRTLTASLFLLTRAAAEGVRVYAVSIVVAIALGTGEIASIAIITALTLTTLLRRVIGRHLDRRGANCDLYWGTLVGVFTILHLCTRRVARHTRSGGACRQVARLRFRAQPLETLYILGRSDRGSLFRHRQPRHRPVDRPALTRRPQPAPVGDRASNPVASLSCYFASFLIVGVMLWAYYGLPSASFGKADYIYPKFIVTRMPHGISGLLIAAILAAAMSNLSAALNSLSSSSMMDFYLRRHPQTDDRTQLRLSRISTLFWALLLFALAVLSLHKVSREVEVGLSIASVAYGALLGVFLLGC